MQKGPLRVKCLLIRRGGKQRFRRGWGIIWFSNWYMDYCLALVAAQAAIVCNVQCAIKSKVIQTLSPAYPVQGFHDLRQFKNGIFFSLFLQNTFKHHSVTKISKDWSWNKERPNYIVHCQPSKVENRQISQRFFQTYYKQDKVVNSFLDKFDPMSLSLLVEQCLMVKLCKNVSSCWQIPGKCLAGLSAPGWTSFGPVASCW